MSGGAWDYDFLHFNGTALRLAMSGKPDSPDVDLTPEQIESRHRLSQVVALLGEAMYQIEWVDSGDSSTPTDVNAVNHFFASLQAMLDGTRLAKEIGKETTVR